MTRPVPTAKCPTCSEPVEVLPTGFLAHHRRIPGAGPVCPPHRPGEVAS